MYRNNVVALMERCRVRIVMPVEKMYNTVKNLFLTGISVQIVFDEIPGMAYKCDWQKEEPMRTKQEVIKYCLTYRNAYEDYPFRDHNWCVIRHRGNNKVFAWIFDREGNVWINVKSDPEWRDFWRDAFPSVLPAYHLNKQHWNSIILDGTVPEEDIQRMIGESYRLTGSRKRRDGKS